MMQPMLDERDAADLVRELIARGRGYVPDWRPGKGMDQALLEAVARYLRSILQRLNRAPEKNLLAFLDMLGIRPVPPQSARAPVVFQLAENASNANIPAGTRLAAPPPPGSTKQILFETEQSLGLAVAKLTQVFSLWPGRDQYIDHSELVASGKDFRAFEMRQLQDTPHSIYLAHDTLLALAGKSVLDVTFELKTRSSEHLDLLWEYWDGKVWREFRNMNPECSEEMPTLDSTNGLQRSGRYRLLTDCAETKKQTVNGIEAFWIRGKLNEPLPPNPLQILPDVDGIQLSTEIVRPLGFNSSLKRESIDGRQNVVQIIDETGTPLFGIKVMFERGAEQNEEFTNLLGLAKSISGERVTVSLGTKSKSANIPDTQKYQLTFAVAVDGLEPDKAFSDALDLDVSKPFYPFGQQPNPGSTFYFTNEELFNKPGASVDIYVQASSSPANQLETSRIEGAQPLTHNVSWEYWNGKRWGVLKTFAGGKSKTDISPDDFTGTGIIKLPVPPDMEEVEVNGQKKKWMRVRLLSGGYGVQATINTGGTNFPFVLPQPPLVSRMLIGYVWQNGPHHAEHVLTYNDFQYEDRTEEAKWPGPVFQPFSVVSDTTPALYLGFDKKLPVDQIGMFLDIVEEHGETKGPPIFWEYWDGINWERSMY